MYNDLGYTLPATKSIALPFTYSVLKFHKTMNNNANYVTVVLVIV